MARFRRSFTGWTFVCLLSTVAVVLAGRTGIGSGSTEGISAYDESKPDAKDSGGDKTVSSTNVNVVSIDQPIFGLSSPATNSEEAGVSISERVKPEAARIVVTKTNDSGEGSLRWAIEQANAQAGPDTIIFNIPDADPGYDAGTGVWTIRPESWLPFVIDNGTVIDGSTQAAFIGSDTNPFGPEIEIDGTNAVSFEIASNNNMLKGLILNRFPNSGLYIMDADSNLVVGCYIGTDATGTIALSNGSDGLQLNAGSSYNMIGGSGNGDRNIISSNGRDGIFIGADCSYNRVINNLIGTDRTGTNPLGNTEQGGSIGNGAVGDSAHNNIIGPGNTIAYNGEYGIVVLGEAVEKNTITQNSITGNGYSGIILSEGGNNDLSSPIITSVTGTNIKGIACPNCTVEIFSDSEDEGEIYEGTTTADGSGKFSLAVSVIGPEVTATATDGDGNTSEFSPRYGTAVIIIVTNTNDSGYRSLRWAIEQANNHAGPDTIIFNIPDTDPGYNTGTGVWTIQPQSELPGVWDGETVIDGTTQSAFIGSDTNPLGPEIEIDGTNAGSYTDGMSITSSHNVIKGMVLNRFDSHGILIMGADSNHVVGNYIGTDASGTVSMANTWEGIQLNGGASYNIIGGSNQGEGNLISGNGRDGILVGADCSYNHVINNLIGPDRSGADSLGNGDYGVEVGGGASGDSAHKNVIGPGNTIAFNRTVGVRIVGLHVVGNTITQNSITQNGSLGIDNFGGNTELAPPAIHNVSASSVSGTVCPHCRVEVFSDPEDEGKMYEGTAIADEFGNFALNVGVTGPNVTATATDTAGNTSEFSEPFPIGPSAGGTIVVTNTNDSGEGSLRWAIDQANVQTGPDTIVFDIPTSDPGYNGPLGLWSIQPDSALPYLTDNGTLIDGTTQTAHKGDTNPSGPEIGIDGTNVNGSGFFIKSSANNTIRGFVINSFSGAGVCMDGVGATGNTVVGNYIGTDATGTENAGNDGHGIYIYHSAHNNVIGGRLAAERNIVSGNDEAGITIIDAGSDSNVVLGNFIGTDVSGSIAIENGRGIQIGWESRRSVIGGDEPGEGNVISGNKETGVWLANRTANNFILGNSIGTDATGTGALGNYIGVSLRSGAEGNFIGGSTPGEGNIISGNTSAGIIIFETGTGSNHVIGNYIGTGVSGTEVLPNNHGVSLSSGTRFNVIGPDNVILSNGGDGVSVHGSTTTGNTITRNSITNNTEFGINNVDGGNSELSPPVIANVSESVVSGIACPGCIVELFSDPEDEGKIYEGTTTADGSGNFTLAVSVTGPYVTATATDDDGNTSEFSTPFSISECLRGDVNCDGNITPGDALCAFWRSILGEFQEECECECSEQAAEVNCDGNITPGDALCIFWRAITGDWPDECQCPTTRIAAQNPVVDMIKVESAEGMPGESVTISIVVESPQGLNAFSAQLMYQEDLLEFKSTSTARATEGWVAVDGVKTGPGVITFGGFHTEPIFSDKALAIVEVVFAVKEDAEGIGEFDVAHLLDDLTGAAIVKGSFEVTSLPTVFSLSQNYPNPFNPYTDIGYQIADHSSPIRTSLKIFNILGQEVRTLVDEVQEAGYHTVTWNGRDSSGQGVPSGVYFYKLSVNGPKDAGLSRTGQWSETKRMLLMR